MTHKSSLFEFDYGKRKKHILGKGMFGEGTIEFFN